MRFSMRVKFAVTLAVLAAAFLAASAQAMTVMTGHVTYAYLDDDYKTSYSGNYKPLVRGLFFEPIPISDADKNLDLDVRIYPSNNRTVVYWQNVRDFFVPLKAETENFTGERDFAGVWRDDL